MAPAAPAGASRLQKGARRAPSFGTLLACLAELRFLSALRGGSGAGVAAAAVFWALSLGAAAGLGGASYALFAKVGAIAREPVWRAFALQLFCFLLSLFWVLFPLVAAQVDDGYELGRFFAYPVSPRRLFSAQALVAVVEPSTLVFYPALLGAALGLRAAGPSPPPPALEVAGLCVAFAAMNLAAGRALLTLFMNLLSSRRSAELLLLLFVGALSLAAFLPPVDATWLFARLAGLGTSRADLALLERTAASLSHLPPGALASGLIAAERGQLSAVLACAAAMGGAALLLFFAGLRLLLRFHRSRGDDLLSRLLAPRRRGRRTPPATAGSTPPDRAGTGGTGGAATARPGRLAAVFSKELVTLFSNPKARLLFAVPLFLLIILKIVGAGPLLLHLAGERWTAALCAATGLYALAMTSGQLFSNGFGYDGDALRWLFWTGTPLALFVAGKNLAQAAYAIAQLAGLFLLALATFPAASTGGLAAAALVLAAALLLLLGLSNLLSVLAPRRFHYSLAKRDRAAQSSVALCLLAAGLAATPLLLALRPASPPGPALGAAAAELAVSLLLYALLTRAAIRLIGERRERLLGAVTSDAVRPRR